MISHTLIVRVSDIRRNVDVMEAQRHDNRLGALLLLWPMGVRSYGLGFESCVWGRGLFSFNISSEPISKSSTDRIQLSSANYPRLHLVQGHKTLSLSEKRLPVNKDAQCPDYTEDQCIATGLGHIVFICFPPTISASSANHQVLT